MLGRFSKILIVDDSRVARRILKMTLNGLGHDNVDEATNGGEALAMLQKRFYALVISDWNMAPMDGLELLQTMRRSPRLAAIPFVMATSTSQVKFAAIARDSGLTHFLAKPVTAQGLAERIDAISGRQSA